LTGAAAGVHAKAACWRLKGRCSQRCGCNAVVGQLLRLGRRQQLVPEPEPGLVLEPGLGPVPALERVAAADRGATADGDEIAAAAVAAIPAGRSAAGVGYGADAGAAGADARRRAARAASWLRGY
jgi:hypothetical protein